MVTLSIIVATLGRPSLKALLGSIHPQLLAGDEVIVVGDNYGDETHLSCTQYGLQVKYLAVKTPKCYGGPQREYGISMASGDYINYQDDDDTMPPEALSIIRQVIAQHSGRPILFQMQYPDGTVRDTGRGGQCFVFPNTRGKIGKFRSSDGNYYYDCDQEFIQTTCDYYPGPILAAPYVISLYSGPHWGK